jgi:hypothetical protein
VQACEHGRSANASRPLALPLALCGSTRADGQVDLRFFSTASCSHLEAVMVRYSSTSSTLLLLLVARLKQANPSHSACASPHPRSVPLALSPVRLPACSSPASHHCDPAKHPHSRLRNRPAGSQQSGSVRVSPVPAIHAHVHVATTRALCSAHPLITTAESSPQPCSRTWSPIFRAAD